ncbi:MAG: N-acetyltransferase [Candidatus Zixiibacteriota bacterium]
MTPGSEPTIRPATLADLPRIEQLEADCFGEDRFTRAQLRYLLTKANCTPLALDLEGRLVGSAFMLWRKGSRVGRLFSIAIDGRIRGKGLGAFLLTACEQAAIKRGCRTISLEVRADNKAAIGLYKRFGYQITGDLPGYYADGANGLAMRKSLAPFK